MGDLDDAIREHLELKRRRGADPDEVARQEQEALSPVTRSHPVVAPPEPVEQHLPEGPAQAVAEPPRRPPAPPREESRPLDAPEYAERPARPQAPAAPERPRVPPAPLSEDPGDETQEFLIDHSRPSDDWLEDDD